MHEQPIRDQKSFDRVTDAVRRALLLVGPPESGYDERPDEDAIAELATK